MDSITRCTYGEPGGIFLSIEQVFVIRNEDGDDLGTYSTLEIAQDAAKKIIEREQKAQERYA